MKTLVQLFTVLLIGLTTVSASESNVVTQGGDLDITKRYRYAQPIVFVERGVEFLIFPDGSFDFNTHIENSYFKKFVDCEAYTEAIKSPNTVSRTVLPNKYIPRIAMGTVETIGPDKVDPHEHAMLEQLFLGLTDNQVVVFADEAQIEFPAYSVLHIPLGSSHSVKVKEGKKMYYLWMDFFLDKKGEEWLKTHKAVEK